LSKKIVKNKNVLRVIDANINRLKEGLRVLEDILRFSADNRQLTAEVKNIRHQLTEVLQNYCVFDLCELISSRQVKTDVGKKSINSELKRDGILDIFLANSQRVKESIRVLEEFFKLFDLEKAVCFKELRYKFYTLEKQAIGKLINL